MFYIKWEVYVKVLVFPWISNSANTVCSKGNFFYISLRSHLCQKSVSCVCVSQFGGALFCYIDLCQSFHQYYTALGTVALEYVLSYWVEYSIKADEVNLDNDLVRFLITLLIFWPHFMSITNMSMLKSLIIIVNFSISPFKSTFCHILGISGFGYIQN